jgi:hypothetical protein
MTMRCTGKSKQSGEQCKRAATPGSTKCHIHGGKSLKGIASPTFKTGRHSKYLPIGLLDTYREHLEDDDRLKLDSEIALIDVRMAEVLESLGDYEGSAAWLQLYALKAKYRDAKNDVEQLAYLREIFLVIDMGASHVSKWNEIGGLIEQRRKVVESERKRLVEAEQVIDVNRAMLLVTALLDAVKTNVTDPAALTAIQTRFNQLTGSVHQ